MKKFIIILLVILFGGSYVMANLPTDHNHDDGSTVSHSGRTDARGCHTNHKTGDYHCHNPKLK